MSWRSTARWTLVLWLGFVVPMAIAAALPWGRPQSTRVAEENVLVVVTLLLPYLIWRMFQPARTKGTAVLDGFVRRGAIPPDDETLDMLSNHVAAVRQQRLPYRYAALAPVPGLMVLGVAAATHPDGLRGSLLLADAVLWLCWVVALNQRELRLRHMEWLLGQPPG